MLLRLYFLSFFFFFNDTATTEIYTLSLHDALPISRTTSPTLWPPRRSPAPTACGRPDRKSTRLNSSHVRISYAVFCLKKKKTPSLSPFHTVEKKNKTFFATGFSVQSNALNGYITLLSIMVSFFFNDTATTEIYTLSLHDALPISRFGGMKTYNWEGVNPDGYFLDKLEPIPSALPSFQKLFQVSATALSIP